MFVILGTAPAFYSSLSLATVTPTATTAAFQGLGTSLYTEYANATYDPTNGIIYAITSNQVMKSWNTAGTIINNFSLVQSLNGFYTQTNNGKTISTLDVSVPIVGPNNKIWCSSADAANHSFVTIIDPNSASQYQFAAGATPPPYGNPLYQLIYGFDYTSNNAQGFNTYPPICTDGTYVYLAGGFVSGTPSTAYIYQCQYNGTIADLAIVGQGPGGSTVSPMNAITAGPSGLIIYAGNHQQTDYATTLGTLNTSTGVCIESQVASSSENPITQGLCYDSTTGAVWVFNLDGSLYRCTPTTSGNGQYVFTQYTYPSTLTSAFNAGTLQGQSVLTYNPVTNLVYGVFTNSATGNYNLVGFNVPVPLTIPPPYFQPFVYTSQWFTFTPASVSGLLVFLKNQTVAMSSLWFPTLVESLTITTGSQGVIYNTKSSGSEIVPLPRGCAIVEVSGSSAAPISFFATSQPWSPGQDVA
jgi:hypothetical protein